MSIKKISLLELFLWLFIFVLLLTLLSPLVMGVKIKHDYPGILKRLSDTLNVDIKINKYDQGFFSSNLDLSLMIPGFAETIKFKEKIIHGPIYFGLLSQRKWPFATAVVQGKLDASTSQHAWLTKVFSNNDTLVYQAIISYLGEIDSQLYLPAINAHLQDEIGQIYINSAGIIINQHYSPVSQHVNAEINIAKLKFKSTLFSLITDSVNISFTGYKGGNALLIGDSIVSVSLLDFYSGVDQFAVKDLVLRSVSSEEGHLINTFNQLKVRELLTSNQKFGPLVFNLNINGINAESLKQLKLLQQENKSKLAQGVSTEQINKIARTKIISLLPNMIKQIDMNVSPLSIASELGQLQAKLDFKLDNISPDILENPMLLLTAINFDLDLTVDPLLLKQLVRWEFEKNVQGLLDLSIVKSDASSTPPKAPNVATSIQRMLDKNWLVSRDQGYFAKITMQKGELLVNNKLVSPFEKITTSKANVAVVQ
ncbi:hypothetical protein MNBD_GAMMA07-2213 [hydrothermal vent metagenome]|uniref:DUF945 domain-containing protein n=1 Tax=hydrothermal vent metagenome TaxID=652676 RepID=A0A3B0X4L5_9ZZZZ